MRSLHVFALTLALIVLSNPHSLHAQVAGTISGYVQDQGGGMMPGATVTAELAGQQLVRSALTNASGFFDLQALPRGTYHVKVEIAGFKTQIQRDVEVTAGANVRLDFTLERRRFDRGGRRHGAGGDGRDTERDAIQLDR